uniref:Uncharacterized protein n=1 Tax=Oryza glumipatula TaxID=40148 RepID=A0A0E0AIN4_9ORYZ
MGLISGMVMGMVVGVALMAGWSRVMQRRSRRRIAKAADIKVLGSLGRDDLKKLCGDNFPEWISFPQYEQMIFWVIVSAVVWKWYKKELCKFFGDIEWKIVVVCMMTCFCGSFETTRSKPKVKWLNKHLSKLWPFVDQVLKVKHFNLNIDHLNHPVTFIQSAWFLKIYQDTLHQYSVESIPLSSYLNIFH